MRIRTMCLSLGLVWCASPLVAQEQPGDLPLAVKSFMERDQLRRWAVMVSTGDSLFNNGSCRRCHGEAGMNGRNGPDLTTGSWVQSDGSLAGIREVIFWGVRRKDFSDATRRFEMNPSGGMDLEWNDFDALAAYVWTLSNGTFLPQR